MPLFDRVCEKCGHTDESLEKHDSPKIAECPECKQMAYVRQIGMPGLKFVGEGFYCNDPKVQKKKGEKEIQKILNNEYKRRGAEPVD